MGARNRVGKKVIVPARPATYTGGINYLESIPGLLKSLKIRPVVQSSLRTSDFDTAQMADVKFLECDENLRPFYKICLRKY